MHERIRVVLALLVLVAIPAAAQFQTGNIHGVVTDSSGSALPGVTVTLRGFGAPRVFISDAQGQFRFLNLDPGRYRLEAELSGFGNVSRTNVDVNVGRNTTADIVMRPAAVQETVTVTADTPLIDARRSGTGATIEEEELQTLPTARDPWVILAQVPGVLVDRVNVGGNESGQQSVYVGKGTVMGQNSWNLDGVNITDTSQYTGFAPIDFDFDSFAEMQVTTGGTDPSVKTAGVNLNIVTKRGTNEFRGSGRFFLTEGDWQADPTIPAEARSYLTQVNEVNHIEDFGAEIGGPIVRDRLWFWGAYAEQNVENLAAAGLPQLSPDNTYIRSANLKLNAQLLPSNSATLVYTENDTIKLGRGAGPQRPLASTWNQGTVDQAPLLDGIPFWKIEDTHVFGQNFFLTAFYAENNASFFLDPIGGRETEMWRDQTRTYHGSYWYFDSTRLTETARADASAFFNTGELNHELKFGFGYRENPTTSVSTVPGSMNWGIFFGAAQSFGLAIITRAQIASFKVEAYDLYAGDTLHWGNLTLQAGLRFDGQSAANRPSSVPANSVFPDLLPAIDYGGDDRELEWNSISPRIGATYALGDEKRTLLRAAYNRYADQLSARHVGGANPFPAVQGLYYYWTDNNGDKTIQRSEIDFDYGVLGGYNVDPFNPAADFSPTRVDYDMDVPTTDEFILGAEHALMPTFVVGINFSHRRLNNMTFGMEEKTRGGNDFYTAADWELSPNSAVGTLPNGQAYSVPFYRLRAGVPAPVFSVITNRAGYTRQYNGIELFATKRLSNRWAMRANIAWNDWTQSLDNQWSTNGDPSRLRTTYGCTSCDGAIVTEWSGFQSGPKESVYINSGWSYTLTGMVELPWTMNLGVSVAGREGYPVPYGHVVNDGTFLKTLLVTEDVDAFRYEDIFNVDLRLAKEFKIAGRAGLTLSLDGFNLTDQRPVLQRQDTLFVNRTTPNVAANRIREIQSPRIFRLGARVTF